MNFAKKESTTIALSTEAVCSLALSGC